MHILIAPDSFKESLSAAQVAQALQTGFSQPLPDASFDLLPVGDGGEGTMAALTAALGWAELYHTVAGPFGQPVKMPYARNGQQALFEMADLVGLASIPQEKRNPLAIETKGLGELILHLAEDGVRKILVGVGGGLTSGDRSARLASHAEENNAGGIVLNGPVDIETTKAVRTYVDIPLIYTVIDKSRPLGPYLEAGVNIFNVSGGKDTVELVKWVREQYPDVPIIASGGKTEENILDTIAAGANAITYTAYGMMEQYFHKKMEIYRSDSE